MSTDLVIAELMRFVVQDKLEALRQTPYQELGAKPKRSEEDVGIEDRKVCICVFVEPVSNARLRVIVQGWGPSRFLGTPVFTDGFLKSLDGSISAMRWDDFEGYV